MSVGEEFWVSPWLVSHAENVIRGAYDDCGDFNCYVRGEIFQCLDPCTCQRMIQKLDQRCQENLLISL